MATINFACFETGDFSEFGGTSGTVSVQTSVVRTGTYAMRCNPTSTGVGSAFFNNLLADGTTGSLNEATIFLRLYFQYLTKPAANDEIILLIIDTVGANKMEVRINSAGNLAAYDSTTTLMATGSTVLNSGTWYRIEVKCSTGNPAAWEVKINGTSEISGSNNLSTSNALRIYVGKRLDRNGNSVDFYYDDCFNSNSAYPGAGQGILLKATANGNYTNGTAHGAGTLWQCEIDVPTDGDTTYIDSIASGQAYTAKFGSSGIGSGTVNCVKGMTLLRQVATPGTPVSRLRSGTTDSDTTSMSLTTSYVAYAKIFDTDPNTSSAWSVANVDLAEAGAAQSAANDMRMTNAFILVDYTPAAAGNTAVEWLWKA